MPSANIPLNERIIFALDVASHEEAMQLIDQLEGEIRFFKVGLQLFLASGFRTIDALVRRGCKVMADLKFFDIPETVKLAVGQLKDRGITFATVHGNDPIVRAAVQGKGNLQLLAVTVLTSFGEEDMRAMGMTGSIADLVLLRARRAVRIGCDGVVASAMEARLLRDELGSKFLIVTPGIRPGANAADRADDQQRIATARQAVSNGADHVVIGRPIRDSSDPVALIRQLHQEIAAGLAERRQQAS